SPASSKVMMAVKNGLADGAQSPVKASVNTSFSLGTISRYWPALGYLVPFSSAMVITLPPPGRRSISTFGVVHGLGANHCLMRSGRVQHWNTLSRGALSRRVSTRSRSVSWVGRELVIAGLLDWQFH